MIEISKNDVFSLRSIGSKDIENLRCWKNRHRNSFFHKEIISHEQQRDWFSAYISDEKNYMFVVVVAGQAIGSMGYRVEKDYIDVYNIMRGVETNIDKFSMADAFKLMLSYIKSKYKLKISCVVLNDNPAFKWYIKNGFVMRKEFDDYSLLDYPASIQSEKFKVKEIS